MTTLNVLVYPYKYHQMRALELNAHYQECKFQNGSNNLEMRTCQLFQYSLNNQL